MKKLILILIFIIQHLTFNIQIFAQDDLMKMLEAETKPVKEKVIATFKTTRIINAHSVEVVKKKSLDVRITHRFGDIAGGAGGVHNWYGFDNATDIRFGFEYGITDKISVGLGRSKGAKMKELVDNYFKYKILTQTTDNKIPVSIVVLFNSATTVAVADTAKTSEYAFGSKFAHRISYTSQIIIARKFSNWLSLQLMPTYIHRNFVAHDDQNGLLAIGVGGRIKFTKRFGLIADYFYVPDNEAPFGSGSGHTHDQKGKRNYHNPLSVGLEWETGGHVFHLNFTNSTGIIENEFIPYTTSRWTNGQFRLGFNISRVFPF